MTKDYYEILGVKKDASSEEIRKAYHQLAHKHHPDKGGDSAKFKEISEAYQVLSDQQKRAQYDQFGSAFGAGGAPGQNWGFNWSGSNQPGQENADFDFSDLGDVFEEFFGFGGSPKRKESQRGRDIEIALDIPLEETLRAQEKEISLERFIKCRRCQGSGGEPGSRVKECFSCRGLGEVQQIKRTVFGSFTGFVTCPECQGEGKKPEKPCNVCHGEGRIRDRERVKIFIPAGVDQNQIIKIEGGGEQGKKGKRPGDLYVRILVRSHPAFERKGDDLFLELPLSFSQLALGDEVEITNLAKEKIILVIPAGSEPGKMLRLSGQGIPHFRGKGQGNLYVHLDIKIPQRLSPKQKELLKKIREEGI
ncbi:MAG: molecular chaperone DnaJ [Candidatus Nealsonbacteria bacterium]|nr:molecular chaperone DnaJ [Candidatus Nealsonbacteria bacterium]